MSRHQVTLISVGRTDEKAIIGYDPPLRTFFLQAFRDPETGVPDLWLGTRLAQFASLPQLLGELHAQGYAIGTGFTDALIDTLIIEASQPSYRSVGERFGLIK